MPRRAPEIPNRRVSLQLPEPVHEQVTQLATHEETTVSAMYRALIEQGILRHTEPVSARGVFFTDSASQETTGPAPTVYVGPDVRLPSDPVSDAVEPESLPSSVDPVVTKPCRVHRNYNRVGETWFKRGTRWEKAQCVECGHEVTRRARRR